MTSLGTKYHFFNVRESRGMIIFQGLPKDYPLDKAEKFANQIPPDELFIKWGFLRWGVNANQIKAINPLYDWTTDYESENAGYDYNESNLKKDYELKLNKARSTTCFLVVIEGIVQPLGSFDLCFLTRYIKNENQTYYHFCGEAEKALEAFYGFQDLSETMKRKQEIYKNLR